jgi:hypothetical protein
MTTTVEPVTIRKAIINNLNRTHQEIAAELGCRAEDVAQQRAEMEARKYTRKRW